MQLSKFGTHGLGWIGLVCKAGAIVGHTEFNQDGLV